jgi:hypothetical protein
MGFVAVIFVFDSHRNRRAESLALEGAERIWTVADSFRGGMIFN